MGKTRFQARRWKNGAQYRQSKENKKAAPNAAINYPPQLFKMQRPLFSSAKTTTEVLIYNEDRSIMTQLVLDEGTIMEVFFRDNPEGDYKVFVNAKTNHLGQLEIIDFIPEEQWPEW